MSTGYVVTAQYELLERALLLQFKSVQPAQLFNTALTWAYQLSKGKSENI